MAKYGPGEVAFFAIGGFSLLGELTGFTDKISGILEDTRPLGEKWGKSEAVGIRFMELTQTGFYNDASGQSNDAIVGKQETAVVLAFGIAGNTIGAEFVGAFGVFAGEYNRAQEREGIHKADATYRVTGVVDQHARILHELSIETAATGDTEASSVDGGDAGEHGEPTVPIATSNTSDEVVTSVPHLLAAGDIIVITGHSGSTPDINGEQTVSSVVDPTTVVIGVTITVGGTGGSLKAASRGFGGAGHLQVPVLVLGGFTDITFGIDDSLDDAAFASLLVFTNLTAAEAAQRVTVAGRVDRFLASNWLFNGAGSGQTTTFLIGFHRNRS